LGLRAKAAEEIELHRRRLERLAIRARQAARLEIKAEAAEPHEGGRSRHVGSGGGTRAAGAPQNGVDTGPQFAQHKGCRHIVIGAELQADDAIDDIVRGRKHQKRHVATSRLAMAKPFSPGMLHTSELNVNALLGVVFQKSEVTLLDCSKIPGIGPSRFSI
jgi:hypothetical protein